MIEDCVGSATQLGRVDFERGVAVIKEENIIYGIRIKYVEDDGYDAGGLSRQCAYTLTLTLTLTLTHSLTHLLV